MCFDLLNNDKAHNERIGQLLLAALQSTVEQLPFLAGSVVPVSKDQAWLHELLPQGAAYLETQDLSRELSFDSLRKASFSAALLDTDQLCPFPDPVYIRDGPIDVCRLRATFIDGGLLLVISIVHTVCDGRGISDVMRIFADEIRRAQSAGFTGSSAVHENRPEQFYSFDRTALLSAHGRFGDIENHPSLTTSPLAFPRDPAGTKKVCANFHISSSSLASLKENASSVFPNAASRISTHDAIAALIWHSIILARHNAGILPDDATTNFTQAVDCRTHLGLPRPYYGNVIYGYKTSLALSDFSSSPKNFNSAKSPGLQTVAHAIRTATDGVTADRFRDVLALVERARMEKKTLRPSLLQDFSIGSVFLISYWRFEMYDLDFGAALGGKIEAFRLPSRGLIPGVPVVLPRLPDGSCEFLINEPEEVMKYLAEDSVLQTFVTRRG
ncbi:MAG: hypothetical protein Q9166_004957 [cf. Caloplaca sp. 2 TL-2023]